MTDYGLITYDSQIRRLRPRAFYRKYAGCARYDRETGPIEFGMKNLGLRIYVPGGKYKGIRV